MDDVNSPKSPDLRGAAYQRPSLDTGVARPSRLQKQRSNAGVRNVNSGQPSSTPGQTITTVGSDVPSPDPGFGDGVRSRKPSIRNAVRRIFGRRSRDAAARSSDLSVLPSASRHTYHRSESSALSPTREESEQFPPNVVVFPDQTLLNPYQAVSSPSFNRTGSPYAVQFPNSVRLKPLDLGNPFMNPSTQLRRRKTLPTMVEGEAAKNRVGSSGESNKFDVQGSPSRSAAQRTSSQVKKSRRKSRSTDDLKRLSLLDEGLLRKRSEEIRYWRESLQPDVSRASGFAVDATTQGGEDEEDTVQGRAVTPQRRSPPESRAEVTDAAADATPIPPTEAGFPALGALSRSGISRNSPPSDHGDFRPYSRAGTELSRDLEDRVAKLEAGLQNFQRSLQRLTADRNRRTVIMSDSNATRTSSNDMRSPSLLAETLADPLEPSSYTYEYGHTQTARLSNSPRYLAYQAQPSRQLQPPEQTQRQMDDPFGPDSPRQVTADRTTADQFPVPSPLHSHPPAQQPPAPNLSTSPRAQPQPYTFSTLYQMIADERSARRRLEAQLRNLESQVASSSNIQSTRSSYMLAGSSSKLQELLRETESSPPSASRYPAQRDSGHSAGTAPPISRFSGSESEGGATEYDELTTPYEAYRTPREEPSKNSLAEGSRLHSHYDDSDMF